MEQHDRPPNDFLTSISSADFELLRPGLKIVELIGGTTLAHFGKTLPRVYFPHSGVISLVVALGNGLLTIEVGMVGRDSVFGASAALADVRSLNEAIVQLPGTASAIDTASLRQAVEQSDSLRRALIRHELFQHAQAQQSAACNVSHHVEARLSRWLLRSRDLVGGDTLRFTQEFLGQMLGVRRNAVALVASELMRNGDIHYHRGKIKITDLNGLIGRSCECYKAVKAQYEMLVRQD